MEPEHIQERDYSADDRKKMAAAGQAMPDGSFPIVDSVDLKAAIKLAGNASNPGAARKHIKRRAKALGLSNLIPNTWTSSKLTQSEDGRTDENHHTDFHLQEIDLAEPSVRPSNGHHIVDVTLIRAGKSANGNFYPQHCLESALPLFEGARCFVDHNRNNQLPERSVRDLVGYYKNTRYGDDRIRSELHLVPGNEWLFNLLSEAQGNPGLCGLSIDAWGDRDTKTGTINSINKVDSIDIVTRPSAGGTVNHILQSQPPTERTHSMDQAPDPQQPPAATAPPGATATAPAQPPPAAPAPTSAPSAGNASLQEGGAHPHNANGPGPATTAAPAQSGQPTAAAPPPNKDTAPDLAKLLEDLRSDRDRMQRELERVGQVLQPGSAPAQDPTLQLHQLVEQMKRERDLERAEGVLSTRLTEAHLPTPVTEKLKKHFSGRIFEASALELAIEEEKSMLAALTASGQITGMGGEKPHIASGMSPYEQVQAAFDALFDIYESDAAKAIPRLSGIREAYRVATGSDVGMASGLDKPLLEVIQQGLRDKVRSGHLTEAESHLREADVTTSTFTYLLGTSMNKRLLSDYLAWPSEWHKFSTIVGIKDFKQQDRIRLGAFGSLSTVAEDTAYTTLSLSDTRAIYTATKRGNLVQVTRETIINDDLYSIKQIPQKLAVAAAFTLAEFVYNLMAPNFGNIYDGRSLFDSVNHSNTGVLVANLNVANSGAALSSGALQTAVIAMRKQKNMASKPIGLKPRYLLVPPDLEFTAMTILKSAGLPGGSNNDINPMMGYAEPIIAPQLNSLTAGPTSTTVWIAVADPRVIDTLEVGFVGGQANPVLLIQDMPLYGLNFTQDTISYKVRHEYGGAIVDYRGFYLGNN